VPFTAPAGAFVQGARRCAAACARALST